MQFRYAPVLALIGGAAYFLPDLLAEFPTEGMAEEAVEGKLDDGLWYHENYY